MIIHTYNILEVVDVLIMFPTWSLNFCITLDSVLPIDKLGILSVFFV